MQESVKCENKPSPSCLFLSTLPIVLWTLHLFIRWICFASELMQAPIPMSSVDPKPLAYVCPQGRTISCRENGKTYKADPLSNRWWLCNLNPIQFPTPCLHSSSFLRRLELTCCPICYLQQEGQGLLLAAGLLLSAWGIWLKLLSTGEGERAEKPGKGTSEEKR